MPLMTAPRHLPTALRAATLALTIALAACVSNPPAPSGGAGTLKQSVQTLANDLTAQINPNMLERMKSRKLVLDPFIDSKSGQQTQSTQLAAQLFATHINSQQGNLRLHPFDAAGVEQADYLVAGTLQADANKSADYQLIATITERRTGLVIARAVSRVRADEIDATPTAFFADSPSLVSDRLTEGQIRTSQAAVGSQADQVYLASISTGAVINEADQAYDASEWQKALQRYQTAVQRSDGQQLRVFNGLYNTQLKLGHHKEAEAAFGQIVALGLGTNNLAMRLLFNPGTTDFWKDPVVSSPYPMWLRHIARETAQGDYCLTVIGHTSRTGTEAVNARLSQSRAKVVRDTLVQNDKRLANRIDTDGVGWRNNIIGNGTDDARDALDRRVEFKVRGCK